MEITNERIERAIAEITKQPERYIDIAIRSDIKIQLLLAMFILDNIEIDDIFRNLLKKIPREILTDLKRSINSENGGENTPKEEIDQHIIKYSLSEDEYKIFFKKGFEDTPVSFESADRYSLIIKNYEYLLKWIEGAISDPRQDKLTELGL